MIKDESYHHQTHIRHSIAVSLDSGSTVDVNFTDDDVSNPFKAFYFHAK